MLKSNLSIFINDVIYWTHVNTSGTVDAFFTIDFIEEGVDISANRLNRDEECTYVIDDV